MIARLTLGLLATSISISTASRAASPPADYTLFVGVDLFLDHDEENIPIRKLERKRALLDNPDRTAVKLDDDISFHWKMSTKVSGTVATINDLDTDRVYSPANDPKMAALKAQSNIQSYLSERLSVAQAAVAKSEGQAHFASAAAANPYNTTTQSADQTATGIVYNADSHLDAAMGTFDTLDSLALTEGADHLDEDGNFDALELNFTVSSTTPVSDAFAVVFAKIKSGEIETSVSFHHEIGRIDSTPRKIRATKTGFPMGYQILETKVHLFSHGEEIASNFSEQRYGLTADQAREFLRIGHIAGNRVGTASAIPAWSIAPADLFGTEDVTAFDAPVTVQVSADGRVTSWSSDGRSLPVRVQNIISQLNFLPAVEKGKPVASTTTVNLAQFFKN